MTRIWKESSTFRRLWGSQHVGDLRLILICVILMMIVSPILLWNFAPAAKSEDQVRQLLTFLAGDLTIGGTIVAWAYQSASKRLGVVDLFACEIITLCRVCTVVDAAHHLIDGFKNLAVSQPAAPEAGKPPTEFGRFTSRENYFPVFGQNASDLQILEADVVTNVTAFYTYMKALRDYMRQLGELQGEASIDQRRGILLNVIYMLFLGFESARKAINDLVEFQPTRAEDKITILLTELPAYGFLLGHYFGNDAHKAQLALRKETYRHEVGEVLSKLRSRHGPHWEKAKSLAPELALRYEQVFRSAAAQSEKAENPTDPVIAATHGYRNAA
jgi:hypothetical protein